MQSVYELPFLSNNRASEKCLHKSGAMRSVNWIRITGGTAWRRLVEYVAQDKTFYGLLSKQEVITALVTSTYFSSPQSSRKSSLEISYSNYTMHEPLTPELNPTAQGYLPRFFTGNFNF
jgi:hypothetical protein